MTAEEVNDFSRTLEDSMQTLMLSAPETFRALSLATLQHCDIEDSAQDNQEVVQPVHRLMRIMSSTKSVSPSPFYPVRQFPW